MKTKQILAGALSAMLSLPAMAQEPVTINGSIINWYVYGADIHQSSQIGWHEPAVGGIDSQAANYGLMSISTANVKAGVIVTNNNTDGTTSSRTAEHAITDFSWLIRNHVLYSNASGVYVGGNTYYSFYMGQGDAWEGEMESELGSETWTVKVRKYTWDGGWNDAAQADLYGQYHWTYQTVKQMNTQPIDLAYDPLNDIVYGIFYDGNTYKFGTIDMETFKVTNISKEGWLYGAPQCVAINSRGEVYGIDASGNVTRINKQDGTLTTIGNVGFVSQQRRMSATFDLRTDKLYWVGYINNGKSSADTSGTNTTLSYAAGGRDTGLYEINTETGEATLIGELYCPIGSTVDGSGAMVWQGYRGVQMTGIYVDGSFTRKDVDQRIILTSYPAQLMAGEQATVKVNVKNIGLQQVLAKNYTVKLYVNGECVSTRDREDDIEPVNNLAVNESQTLTFTFTAPATGEAQVYAEVVNEDDQELRNNKTDVASIIVLGGKTLPNPTLNGQVFAGRGLKLSWADPNGHVTESAEEFAAFSYEKLNDWVMYDGDGGYTGKPNNMFGTVEYANSATPKAFIVMDPYKAGLGPDHNMGGEKFLPHTGNQYFAAFISAKKDGDTSYEVANDDYMVSPLLSGAAQTISFWAKGYRGVEYTGYATEMAFNEELEVLYTTQDVDMANIATLLKDGNTFQVAKEKFTINDKAWTQYEVALPEGAKHFVLHRVSDVRQTTDEGQGNVEIPGTGSFIMMIDDIEFNMAPQTVTGYKVFKNGLLVATLAADKTTYNDDAYTEGDSYTVKAVYADGESAKSNAWPLVVNTGEDVNTGIEQAPVKPAASNVRRMYDMNGRLVSGQLRPGMYILQENGKTHKVVIK